MPTDDDLLAELRERWAATLPGQPEIGEDLLRRYGEPHRRYHTAAHLQQVLAAIDRLADDQDLYLVRLAAWFHDAVYAVPPGQLSNEEASARLAIRTLSRAGLEQEDLNQVARLVRLTATHLPGTRDPEGELLSDADLAILAAEPAAYATYVGQVREEYAPVSDEDFARGRLAILTEFASRPLYRTGQGQQLLPAARANLHGEIRALSERLGIEPPEVVQG